MLKQILKGLAHQNDGEYLTLSEKESTLGRYSEAADIPMQKISPRMSVMPSKRIALLTDGSGHGAPLDYVLETCDRQGAGVDLLLHADADMTAVAVIENKLKAAGLRYERVKLGHQPIESVISYINHQKSLIYIVSVPVDSVAKLLIEDVIPKRVDHVSVPVVLIEDRSAESGCSKSVA